MRYRLSRRADNELIAIYEESVEQFGASQAEIYYAELISTFTFLAEFPRAVREREELASGIRAYPHQAHLIVYRIEEDRIFIICLPHGRSDWANDLG